MVSTDDDTANKVSSDKEDREKGLFDEDDDSEGKTKKTWQPIGQATARIIKNHKEAGRKEEKECDVGHFTTQ